MRDDSGWRVCDGFVGDDWGRVMMMVVVCVMVVIIVMVVWLMVVMGFDDWHNWRLDNSWHDWLHIGGVVDRRLDDGMGWVCMGSGQIVVMWIFADDAGVVLLDVRVWRGDHFAVVRHRSAESVVNALMRVTVRWNVRWCVFEGLGDDWSGMVVVVVEWLRFVDGLGDWSGSVLDGLVDGWSVHSGWLMMHVLVTEETSVGGCSQHTEQYDELKIKKLF